MEKSIQKVFILPFLAIIKVYRLVISPWLPFACRYQPTCSEYSKEAFERYGVIKGLYLTMRRVTRCHPWGGSGYNPVPLVMSDSKNVSDDKLQNKHCCDKKSHHS